MSKAVWMVVFALGLLLFVSWTVALMWLLEPDIDLISNKWGSVGVGLIFIMIVFAVIVGKIRWAMRVVALMWLALLSALLSKVLIELGRRLGVGDDFVYRWLIGVDFLILVAYALFNAYVPTVRKLSIKITKPLPFALTLAVASDLHLGWLFGRRGLVRLERILRRNAVDVLLLPGDIMDDNTQAFERYHMAEQLQKTFSAAQVVVASFGNHDLYQMNAYQSISQALGAAGAMVLADQSAVIEVRKNGTNVRLQLIGRFDDHHQRQPTAALLKAADLSLPVILLDHRPSEIITNSALPIDLQVSGHTHNGQIFPANLIVKAINRLGYGYEKINGTHFVVSSGFGFWGIPLRLGSRSEVWIIDVRGS